MIKRHTDLMNKAFSLFELLISITIVGILTAIGYPLYTEHVAKVQRESAAVALLEIANRLEQAYSINNTYEHIAIDSLVPSEATSLPFRFVLANATNEAYLLKAIPLHAILADTHCTTLTLASDGTHCW